MRLAGTEFSLDAGAFDIFVSGCRIKCKGCFNPEAQEFDFGEELDTVKLIEKIKTHSDLIKSIRFMGGDLLSQNSYDAIELAVDIELNFPEKNLILYTGEEFENIPDWAFTLFDEIKYGPYIEELKCEHHLYGSSNQGYWIKEE